MDKQKNMTRQEQIRASAVRDTSCFEHQKYYELGAQWADEHPRKGLWDSEKVIDWLKKNCTFFDESKGKERCIVNIYALSQAMEE